ncbi:related to GNAT family acetyltransferase [Cephalotrichum gorgonifer]|uniref:Related to GNAT family acetyltransferase n=1 Tax=Cephalotrichum gorgonifer TaxID=2041049 RepID=A0AAE8SXB4_9PEZI|nr:related to GNAT family acetyltransferase [Cephalotrichum gorgonifer]
MEYHFIKVDREEPDIHTSATKYKALRLEALRQSPTAFSSTLEVESQFSDSVWISRLQNAEKETFVCVATAKDGQSQWVGQVTLRGPVPAEEFLPPAGSEQPTPAPDDEVEKWQMLSLYTLPSHRGMKLGSRLCEKAFEFLRSRDGEGARRIMVRIMVKPENVATLRLYDGLGFERAGYCTLEEALRANGDTGLIPAGTLDDHYTTRSGIVMVLPLERMR